MPALTNLRNLSTVTSKLSNRKGEIEAGSVWLLSRSKLPTGTSVAAQQLTFPKAPQVEGKFWQLGPEALIATH